MKLNWGHYIAIFLVAFMLFILSFVYRAMVDDRYDHKIIDNYYEKEIKYQDEIDAVDKAKELDENVKLVKTETGLIIAFPLGMGDITGKIELQRPSNPKFDVNVPIILQDNTILINKDRLIPGLYNVIIQWNAGNTDYMYKEKFTY